MKPLPVWQLGDEKTLSVVNNNCESDGGGAVDEAAAGSGSGRSPKGWCGGRCGMGVNLPFRDAEGGGLSDVEGTAHEGARNVRCDGAEGEGGGQGLRVTEDNTTMREGADVSECFIASSEPRTR